MAMAIWFQLQLSLTILPSTCPLLAGCDLTSSPWHACKRAGHGHEMPHANVSYVSWWLYFETEGVFFVMISGHSFVDRHDQPVQYGLGARRTGDAPFRSLHSLRYAYGSGQEDSVLLPGMELMGCQGLAVPTEVMHHVVRVESSYNPYALVWWVVGWCASPRISPKLSPPCGCWKAVASIFRSAWPR